MHENLHPVKQIKLELKTFHIKKISLCASSKNTSTKQKLMQN